MPAFRTTAEHAKLREESPEGTLPRALRIMETQIMPNGTARKRSLGFHWPQKPRKPKQEMPK